MAHLALAKRVFKQEGREQVHEAQCNRDSGPTGLAWEPGDLTWPAYPLPHFKFGSRTPAHLAGASVQVLVPSAVERAIF